MRLEAERTKGAEEVSQEYPSTGRQEEVLGFSRKERQSAAPNTKECWGQVYLTRACYMHVLHHTTCINMHHFI